MTLGGGDADWIEVPIEAIRLPQGEWRLQAVWKDLSVSAEVRRIDLVIEDYVAEFRREDDGVLRARMRIRDLNGEVLGQTVAAASGAGGRPAGVWWS